MDSENLIPIGMIVGLIAFLALIFITDYPRMVNDRELCKSLDMRYAVQGPMGPSVCINSEGQVFLIQYLKKKYKVEGAK